MQRRGPREDEAGGGTSTSHKCQGPPAAPGGRTGAWDIPSLGASRRNQPGRCLDLGSELYPPARGALLRRTHTLMLPPRLSRLSPTRAPDPPAPRGTAADHTHLWGPRLTFQCPPGGQDASRAQARPGSGQSRPRRAPAAGTGPCGTSSLCRLCGRWGVTHIYLPVGLQGGRERNPSRATPHKETPLHSACGLQEQEKRKRGL